MHSYVMEYRSWPVVAGEASISGVDPKETVVSVRNRAANSFTITRHYCPPFGVSDERPVRALVRRGITARGINALHLPSSAINGRFGDVKHDPVFRSRNE
jgi:hypothetical protein